MSDKNINRDPMEEFNDGRLTLDEYPAGVKIRILASQLYAADGIGTWGLWVREGEQHHFSTCIYEKEYYSFLEIGNCLSFMLSRKEGFARPVVMSDALGLTWLAEHVFRTNGEKDILVIIGPMFMSSSSLKRIEKELADRISSVQMRLNLMRTLNRIPVVSYSSLMHYGKVMHLTIRNEYIGTEDFIYQDEQTQQRVRNEEDEPELYAPGPKHADDRLRQGEKMILTAVREGNLKYREIMENELSFTDTCISNTGDDLRDGKISVTVFTAQCSRAAIEGGLPSRTACAMERDYYTEIENCRTIMSLKGVMDRMLGDYVTAVGRCRENESASRSIRECCDYIRANVTRSLTAEEIASEMGYTPYYLTRKFSRETGVKINDYIKQTKIEYAKVLLMTTNRSIQEISDMLQFSSRNYFTKVFTSVAGITPTAFREQT